jgi:hypothetical protein
MFKSPHLEKRTSDKDSHGFVSSAGCCFGRLEVAALDEPLEPFFSAG